MGSSGGNCHPTRQVSKLCQCIILKSIIHHREVTAAGIAKLAAIEDDQEDDDGEVDSDAENHGSYPHSPTPDNDRPSTITEVRANFLCTCLIYYRLLDSICREKGKLDSLLSLSSHLFLSEQCMWV